MAESESDRQSRTPSTEPQQVDDRATARRKLEAAFAMYGLEPGVVPSPETTRNQALKMREDLGTTKQKRVPHRRRRYKKTGKQMVLDFVGEQGGATSREIARHWKAQRRIGKVHTTLFVLVREGRLKKQRVEGQRASTYTLA